MRMGASLEPIRELRAELPARFALGSFADFQGRDIFEASSSGSYSNGKSPRGIGNFVSRRAEFPPRYGF